MRTLSLALVALAVGLGACGGAAPPLAAPSGDVAAPYPFTVAEIRAGCPMGRVIEYRVEKGGGAPTVERWEFTPLDEETVKIVTTDFDAAGNPAGAPETETDKWTALHEHAHFPQSATKISNESITLPAGTFDVMKYVVTSGGDDTVKTLWFARTLPGPPVKLEIAKGGAVVMAMTMQANRSH